MNGVDEYSNYLGPEPTDDEIRERAIDNLLKKTYEEKIEMLEDIGIISEYQASAYMSSSFKNREYINLLEGWYRTQMINEEVRRIERL